MEVATKFCRSFDVEKVNRKSIDTNPELTFSRISHSTNLFQPRGAESSFEVRQRNVTTRLNLEPCRRAAV